jgi:hypothetical protein
MITTWRCPVCRIAARIPVDTPQIHCACGFIQLGVELGLGDVVAAVLHKMGITRARYIRAKRLLGLKSKCGCSERQAALNRFGRAVMRVAYFFTR